MFCLQSLLTLCKGSADAQFDVHYLVAISLFNSIVLLYSLFYVHLSPTINVPADVE